MAATRNRIGFAVLGLTNNFAYVIMLSAAYDLLALSSQPVDIGIIDVPATGATINATSPDEKYCKSHSTSTILLADTLPSLTTKIVYPFLLVGINTSYKAVAVAVLSAIAFLASGLTTNQVIIFAGVISAAFSSGLGESTYVSNSHLFGESSLSGWSIGTGGAGLLGSLAYAVLRIFLSVKIIMIIMLIVPVAMMVAYFYIIVPTSSENEPKEEPATGEALATLNAVSQTSKETEEQSQPFGQSGDKQVRSYGVGGEPSSNGESRPNDNQPQEEEKFDFSAKIRFLPSLLKYFMPLLLVYYSEYFINQGLFELIYFPEITYLDKSGQYRWFQVSYQLGVMISRSTLDLFRIKQIWLMSLLQAANALLFLFHVAKLIHIPSFYLVIALIVYEGLLGGFTYVNAFYRIKKEVRRDRLEFSTSAVLVGDSLGIVFAALTALPAYNELCKLYE